MKFTVRMKLVVCFVALIAITVGALGGLSYIRTKEVVSERFNEANMELVKTIQASVSNYMATYRSTVELVAKDEASVTINTAYNAERNIRKRLETIMESNEDVIAAYMGTESGKLVMPESIQVEEGFDYKSRPWYQAVVNAQSFVWTEPYQDQVSGAMVVTAAVPVRDLSNKFIGVIGLDVDLSNLAEEMNSIQVGQEGYPVLIDNSLRTMSHKNPDIVGKEVPVEKLKNEIMSKTESTVDYVWGEEAKTAIFSKMPDMGWTVMVTMGEKELKAWTEPIMTATTIIGLFFLVVGIIAASFFSRALVKPLHKLVVVMDHVKEGDLTERAIVTSKDEIGELGIHFNDMLDKVSDLMRKSNEVAGHVSENSEALAATAEQVNTTSLEVSRTIEEIAVGAGDQAGEAEKGSILVSNLAEKFESLAENSAEIASQAEGANAVNANGMQAVAELQEKTSENSASAVRVQEAIRDLDQRIADIGGILTTITDIADQTNLLALNASIEAARAGEHGRGFAVVADEIRKLAEGSNQAAENIRGIVKDVQSETLHTVDTVQEVVARSEEQSQAVKAVEEAFAHIDGAISEISGMIGQMTQEVVAVNSDKDAIVASIENISAVSEESAAASEEVTASVQQQTAAISEVARASEHLRELAEELESEIRKFKI